MDDFKPTDDHWFKTTRASRNRIEASYIEKVTISDAIEDPFGKIRTYERVEFRKTEFLLVPDFPQLQLRNAPRSRRDFLARLGKLAENEIAIEPVQIDVMATVARLEKSIGILTVCEMTISDYPLSVSASANIVISGAGDVREQAARFTRNRYSLVTSVSLIWDLSRSSGACNISSGSVSFEDDTDARVEHLIRDALVPVQS